MADFSYGFAKTLDDKSFEAAVSDVTAALQDEGFGVLSQIDVQATLKKKVDVDPGRYLILGACNPTLAKQAVSAEPHIGLLLPCNVLIRQPAGEAVEVSIADPRAMFQLVGNAEAHALAEDARARLVRVLAAL